MTNDVFRLCAFADEADAALTGQIAALKENGIALLELRGVDGVNVAALTAEQTKEIRRRLDDAGIAVWSLGSPTGKSDVHRDFSLERESFLRLLDTAHRLGARHLRLFSFYDAYGSRDEVLARLGCFAELARGSGVTLCHENEKGIYGDCAARCLDLLQNVDGLRAVFDPANFVQCGEDPLAAWKQLAPYVAYVHVKDALPDGRVVPAGDGQGQLAAILRDYRARGGSVISAEPHLFAFVGLKGLEQEGDVSVVGGMHFADSRTAFDYAIRAIRTVCTELK